LFGFIRPVGGKQKGSSGFGVGEKAGVIGAW
jgi:hypothetical protein